MMDKPLDPNIPLQAFAVLGEYQAELERILIVVHLDHVTSYCGYILYYKTIVLVQVWLSMFPCARNGCV